jgi:alpha-ketoglutarate-dependent taurine dioxygenase
MLADLKIPNDQRDTTVADVIHAARNMSSLEDVQHMIYNFTEGS